MLMDACQKLRRTCFDQSVSVMHETIPVTILLFAGASEAVGADKVKLTVKRNCTAGYILEQLAGQFPELRELLASCRLAVDCEYVSDETLVNLSDSELALIPPVSGG